MEKSRKTLWLLFVGVLAVSSGAILVRLCDAPPLSVGAYRLTLGLPFFWLWAARSQTESGRGPSTKPWGLLVLSGLFLGLHFATWVASLSYTSVASSVVLVTTNPLFVGMGSLWLFRERINKALWTGTAVAFLGTVVVAFSAPGAGTTASNPALGNALALLGAVCMSGYLLLGRRLSGHVPTSIYVAIVYTVAAATLWAAVLWSGSPCGGFSQKQWLYLILMAVLPQGVGHTLINRSLQHLAPSTVATAILAEPVLATLLAIPVLHEYPTVWQGLGSILVISGVRYAIPSKSEDSSH